MIYIKNIYKSNEKLIVEKHIYNEQSFYKFEHRFQLTHCRFCSCFFVSNNVVTYIFLDFHHKIISNIIFAVFLFRVLVCYYFIASNIKFVNVLYCKRSSAIVT